MTKRMVALTLPKAGGSGHTRIESWGGDDYHDRYFRFDARRGICDGTEEAQIEVMVIQSAKGRKHTTTISGSVILTPHEARALALAICPELAPK